MSSLGKNFGAAGSPDPTLIVKAMKLRSSASVGDYDSVNKLARRAFDVGSQGNVNAYKSLGLIVG